MAPLDAIRAKVSARPYLLSRHAADQMIRRDIQAFEIEEALLGPSGFVP